MRKKDGIIKGIMKIPMRVKIVALALVFVGGGVTALALQPSGHKRVEIQQTASIQPQELVAPTGDSAATADTLTAQTAESQAEPQPTPVTVVAVEQVPVAGGKDVDCKLTYSDGTTYQWHWKIVGGTTTNTSGYCDERIVGKAKAEGTSNGWGENDPNWQSHIWDGVN